MSKKEKAFNNWRHNAIHLTFPNGNSLSTTWAFGTYSENYDMDDIPSIKHWETFRSSNTCEIMILEAPDNLVKRIHRKYGDGDDSVIGYLTMKEWLEIVRLLSHSKGEK